MAALLKGNALFLHIPKTGGSLVRHVLRKQGLVKMEWPHTHPSMDRVLNLPRYYPLHFIKQSLKHQTVSLYHEVQNSFKFCFVRHPYSWYESYWRFMTGLDWKSFGKNRKGRRFSYLKKSWHPTKYLEQLGPADFNSFVESVLEKYPGYLTQMYGWYAPPGEIDFVGRTESLVDDLLAALNRIGIDVDEEEVRGTPKVNTSPSRIDRPTWNDDLRAAVRRLEAPIFQKYKYDENTQNIPTEDE